MAIAPARPASTVVLLRPSPRRFEVFMVRRRDSVAFMGGAHVFPGGRVDTADMSFGETWGFHAAAARELFEEAGVLLARRQGSEPVAFSATDAATRFQRYRADLAGGAITLREVMEREQLAPDFEALVMFAHWVTPEVEIKRFDTRFFVAAAPVGQEAAHDDLETTHGEWLDPAEAVDRCRRDEIALPPPTWTTLRMLSRLGSVDEALRWARGLTVVRVQPALVATDAETRLMLPGDPDVPPVEGWGVPEETRFILVGGRWKALEARAR